MSGVRTDGGERLAADLVVDAMGRRSRAPELVRDAGGPPVHEGAEDSGFVYYTRFFRSVGGGRPKPRALAERVMAAAAAHGDARIPGPGREELLELLSAAGARATAG